MGFLFRSGYPLHFSFCYDAYLQKRSERRKKNFEKLKLTSLCFIFVCWMTLTRWDRHFLYFILFHSVFILKQKLHFIIAYYGVLFLESLQTRSRWNWKHFYPCSLGLVVDASCISYMSHLSAATIGRSLLFICLSNVEENETKTISNDEEITLKREKWVELFISLLRTNLYTLNCIGRSLFEEKNCIAFYYSMCAVQRKPE